MAIGQLMGLHQWQLYVSPILHHRSCYLVCDTCMPILFTPENYQLCQPNKLKEFSPKNEGKSLLFTPGSIQHGVNKHDFPEAVWC